MLQTDQIVAIEVEEIRGRRVRAGHVQYLVKWKGYGSDEDTWEDQENCSNCDAAVRTFDASHPPARRGRPPKKPLSRAPGDSGESAESDASTESEESYAEEQPKRRRGRPPKALVAPAPAAAIEIEADEFSRLLDPELHNALIAELKEAGYRFVTLDLAGYRTGSTAS